MGIELAIGAAALALGAVSTGVNVAAAGSAASDRKKAFDAETKSNNVQIAQAQINSSYDRRARIREDRVRQAQIAQGSENGGTAGSSAEAGALGSLRSNFDALGAQSSGQSKANVGLNRYNQEAAQYDQNARNTLAWNDVFQSGVKTAQNVFNL